jgi:hypothetical protein
VLFWSPGTPAPIKAGVLSPISSSPPASFLALRSAR